MYRKSILFIFTFLFSINLLAQSNCLKNDIQTYYLDNCENKSLNSEKDSITICFEYGFSEETQVYLNDNLVLHKKLEQLESISSANQTITCDFVKYGKYPTLKIYLLKSKGLLDVVLNSRYNFLFINKLEGKWSLIYRNTPIARE
ncbi:hypothetical protein [Flavobacterium sp. GSP14]|uniref:hypothetical protein n=1 Tax=Flavobacterium sp. GSP14 TaxID=3401734 RepID=UPI003AAD8C25